MDREDRLFQGWAKGEISKDIVSSTEGQLPPPPKFEPPELFTDLDGITYTYGGRLEKAFDRVQISHFYYIPGEQTTLDGRPMSKTQRIIRETYLKNVLEIQENERELKAGEETTLHEQRSKNGILYENGHLTHGE